MADRARLAHLSRRDRGGGQGRSPEAGLEPYVNDRPYAASSMLESEPVDPRL